MMPSAVVLVLYALAITRATTLITHDEITRPARERIIDAFDPHRLTHRLLVYLLIGTSGDDGTGCPWCVSIWIGMVTAPVVYVWGDTPVVSVVLLALASSEVAGMFYAHGRR